MTRSIRKIAQYLDRDDMVATAMSTFQSATVHCARCHDHKFDPISQPEYYNLQAVFAGVDRAKPFVCARRQSGFASRRPSKEDGTRNARKEDHRPAGTRPPSVRGALDRRRKPNGNRAHGNGRFQLPSSGPCSTPRAARPQPAARRGHETALTIPCGSVVRGPTWTLTR